MMRGIAVVTGLACLATLLLVANPISAQDADAPLKEFFTLQVKGGLQIFDYKEELSPVESDYDSVAPAWGVTASLRFAERWRLNGEYLGSFVPEETETWSNVGTVAGLPVTQENELEVDFHSFDVDVAYSIAKRRDIEWAVAAGWHYYLQDFERSDFRFLVSNIVFAVPIQPVSEEVKGQGVKLGTTLDARIGRRAVLTTGLAGYYLYDVDVDNSALGSLSSEGWALRWKLGVDFLLTDNATVGAEYGGHYIRVDEARKTFAILPENRTIAHSVLVRLGVRF